MHPFQIYYEPADNDADRQPLGKMNADSMSQALELASQFYEKPAHDLVAIQFAQAENREPALIVPTIQVNEPCEECGSTDYPNLKYYLVGLHGVLCRSCLMAVIEQVNNALGATKDDKE